MRRSLVTITLLLVGGVVVLLGLLVVNWIAEEDRVTQQEATRIQTEATTEKMRDLAELLVSLSQDTARGIFSGVSRRYREWLDEEPLSLYRDPRDPEVLSVELLAQRLRTAVRQQSRFEEERLIDLVDRITFTGDERIREAVRSLEESAAQRAEAVARERGHKLTQRLVLLLVGMAVLLAATLVVLVVRPVQRLRRSVNRIAGGDLTTPVPPASRGATELAQLTQDVERMRDQIRRATEGLEQEVARQTEQIQQTLEDRTHALDELRRTKDRLVQAAKMAGLGTLAGGVAHEFNNLIGGILGCLESAQSMTTEPDALEDLEMAKKTAGRAATLVTALLDVARPGTRDVEAVSLEQVIDDVLWTAAPTASQRRIEVVREAGASPSVMADEGQVHQVVLNLVTNAIHASDEGDRVVVAMGEADGQGYVEVRDSGPGIPEEDRDRIFEPFFTGRSDGTGLGLFVSYGIVERHGGHIEVGTAPEGGARLRVWIPLAEVQP